MNAHVLERAAVTGAEHFKTHGYAQGTVGHRDIWVIEINRWHKRAYGPAHERRASEATLSVEATA